MVTPSLFDTLIPSDTGAVAVAVSGGADSFALLHLAQSWTAQHNIRLTALTVDHGLRTESADEAKAVAQWCNTHNIEHHILLWQGDKPSTAIQDTARQARRRLLCDFCKDHAIPILLTGHQADDQAETMIMRLHRGSGLHGLLCIPNMAMDTATQITLLRPLLSERRETLRDYCIQNSLPFIDDPSNENKAFERIKIRNMLKIMPDFADGVVRSIARLRLADAELEQRAKTWQTTHSYVTDQGRTWLPRQEFITQSDALQLRILGRFFTGDYVPLEGLEKLLPALQNDNFKGQTLDGLWIHPKTLNKTSGFLIETAPARKTTISA